MEYKNLLEVQNPTKGQLILIRDTYSQDEIIEYMSCRWEYKFNYGKLTEKDLHKFHNECDILKVDSFEVTSNMNDYGLIYREIFFSNIIEEFLKILQ